MTTKLLRETAKELAGADYEGGEHSERFRKFWPNVHVFIARNWPRYLVLARTLLTEMLRRPETEVPESQKEAIFEALLKDREESARQPSTKVGMGALKLRPDQPGTLEKKLFH